MNYIAAFYPSCGHYNVVLARTEEEVNTFMDAPEVIICGKEGCKGEGYEDASETMFLDGREYMLVDAYVTEVESN